MPGGAIKNISTGLGSQKSKSVSGYLSNRERIVCVNVTNRLFIGCIYENRSIAIL